MEKKCISSRELFFLPNLIFEIFSALLFQVWFSLSTSDGLKPALAYSLTNEVEENFQSLIGLKLVFRVLFNCQNTRKLSSSEKFRFSAYREQCSSVESQLTFLFNFATLLHGMGSALQFSSSCIALASKFKIFGVASAFETVNVIDLGVGFEASSSHCKNAAGFKFRKIIKRGKNFLKHFHMFTNSSVFGAQNKKPISLFFMSNPVLWFYQKVDSQIV